LLSILVANTVNSEGLVKKKLIMLLPCALKESVTLLHSETIYVFQMATGIEA